MSVNRFHIELQVKFIFKKCNVISPSTDGIIFISVRNVLQQSKFQLKRENIYDISLNRGIFRNKINASRALTCMCVYVCARMYERTPSSGPTLRHEVKETAIGRRCARKRKGETANEVAGAARGERK